MIYSITDWLYYYGLRDKDGKLNYINDKDIIVYKRVSYDYKTQEGTKNETLWLPGVIVEMGIGEFNPYEKECGEGKYHGCGNPRDCYKFRSYRYDKFVAIKVKKEDIFLWSKYIQERKLTGTLGFILYPEKIMFRKGEVLYECDIDGNRIEYKE